mmetsp:Transcript_27040/g.56884  ORF Transcript_27040/g.56884 Transcript_27040/m.56884 type:complete len:91 (-) Transcript_27040:1847-2119(-)
MRQIYQTALFVIMKRTTLFTSTDPMTKTSICRGILCGADLSSGGCKNDVSEEDAGIGPGVGAEDISGGVDFEEGVVDAGHHGVVEVARLR